MTEEGLAGLSGYADWTDSAQRRHLTRLAQVAQTTTSAVIITDRDGVVEWVNAGFTRISGYALEEAAGRTPAQLLHGPETDLNEAARIGAALRARESVAAELINYAKDGRRYWVGMKIEPLIDANGELDGFMATAADITDRHEQRQALDELSRRFDMATQAARVGTFERDGNWEIVWWSPAMWEIFGQDPRVFKPTNKAWLELIHPDDRQRIEAELRHWETSSTAGTLQYRIIRPDGQIRHIQATGAIADPQNGAGERIVGITLDVTERVLAEEREQALQRELRESSHRAGMVEIATGVLHNVGNVLNSLGVANSTARRELKGMRLDKLELATTLLLNHRDTLTAFLTDDERGRHLPEYLPALSAQISSNSRSIETELETTEKLLQHLSDIVGAQQELAGVGGRREPIRLNELVETALLVQSSELAQIEVVREYEELPCIMTDRHKLLQILVNLISNARDAIEQGASERSRILVQLARDPQHALVTIEDSGIGMGDEVLAKIWQFGFTTKRRGHGFGLHNSANAAHEIGATLSAHSDGVGHGSRFVLRLPLDDPGSVLSGVAA